jgi:HEAT repeat protein
LLADSPLYIPGPEIRAAAVEMLGRFPSKSPEALKAVLAGVSDKSDEVMLASIVALRAYPDAGSMAIPRLSRILATDKEPAAREAADTLRTYGRDGRRATASYRIRRLSHSASQFEFVDLLGIISELGPDAADAVPVLQAPLSDSDNALRIRVAQTLGEIGPAARPAITALSRMADNTAFDVRQSASIALVKISPDGKDLAPALLASVYNADRSAVARIAAAIARDRHAPSLHDRLADVQENDPEAPVRAAAKQALESLAQGR